jgi:2-polyprenyl-6-methoxyphenol hydroxylase-like FAD-dependent oxidoreductase
MQMEQQPEGPQGGNAQQSASGETAQTTCCIVGAGPAGAMLALLLARQGIAVTLLEAHGDFERDFRGDTLHASVLELLDELGLAERLLALRHAKVRSLSLPTPRGSAVVDLFGALRSKFPYITVMAQSQFLAFITEEAAHYPNFRLIMGARVEGLIEEQGVVRGVRYRGRDGHRVLRAALVVGADGRFSLVRKLAGFVPIATSSPIDVLWFRLSRRPDDSVEALAPRLGHNLFLVCIDRFEYWQIGCVIIKGGYPRIRAAGLAQLRATLAAVAPEFADRVDELQDWRQLAVLAVESSRLRRWHRPGLLLIGDAAHVMSPVGGVGINYAIQDAVVAANLLSVPLKQGGAVPEHALAAVQGQRELPTRIIQAFQALAQQRVSALVAGDSQRARVAVPQFILPLLRRRWLLAIPARFIAYGFCPPRLR